MCECVCVGDEKTVPTSRSYLSLSSGWPQFVRPATATVAAAAAAATAEASNANRSERSGSSAHNEPARSAMMMIDQLEATSWRPHWHHHLSPHPAD